LKMQSGKWTTDMNGERLFIMWPTLTAEARQDSIQLCSLSQTSKKKHFTILEVAGDCHELITPQNIIQSSIACASK